MSKVITTKRKVYITVEGMERIVKGEHLYNWYFTTAGVDDDMGDGYHLVGEFEVSLPSAADCIKPVLDKLKKKEDEIQAEAFAELRKVQQRRNDLLTIGFQSPTEVPLETD
jgi:hypothetical protein